MQEKILMEHEKFVDEQFFNLNYDDTYLVFCGAVIAIVENCDNTDTIKVQLIKQVISAFNRRKRMIELYKL